MGRILIACHDSQMRRGLSSNLFHDHHTLTEAKDMAEARERISAEDYDCAFLEAELPGDGGLEQIVASVVPNPATSVIVLASPLSFEAVVNRVGSAVFQVLAKPFLPAQIRAAAQRGCERSVLIRDNKKLRTIVARVEEQVRALPSTTAERGRDKASVAPELSKTGASGSDGKQGRNLSHVTSGQSFDLSGVLDQIEKELIEKVLFQAGGLQAEAARRMGLSRSALAYKLQKHGIRLSNPQSPA
ncbi:MAG TPA: helix-turn-helix domain-containing protein [Terriglobales bacterium]|nr:helix-turn-helix domain-containing protein [Terriglobales bacterium]